MNRIMLTKNQKKEQVALGKKLTEESKSLIFADFSGAGVEDLRKLKAELKEASATFKVFKKRLLKLAFKEMRIDFDPTQFDFQVGTIFIPGELISAAGAVYKFSKELAKKKKDFKILGAYELEAKNFLDIEQFTILAKLPSREILLAQVMGALTGPVRAFMRLLSEIAQKQPAESKGEAGI